MNSFSFPSRQGAQLFVVTFLACALSAPAAWAGQRGVHSSNRGSNNSSNRNSNNNSNRNVNVNQNSNRNVNANVNVNSNRNRNVNVDVDVHHHGGYYHNNGNFWGGVATGLVIGAIITAPPPYHTTVVYSNTTYIVSDDVYYVASGTGYMVVNPPIGVTVGAIPPGAVQVNVNGVMYYQASGMYYRPAMQNGVTVYTTVQL